MTDRAHLFARGVGWYYFVVGGALLIGGWRTGSWWTEVLGLAFLVVAAGTLLGDGEWTTWFRGEMDERRRQAADHGFRVAFFVLAWWIGAVAIYAVGWSLTRRGCRDGAAHLLGDRIARRLHRGRAREVRLGCA